MKKQGSTFISRQMLLIFMLAILSVTFFLVRRVSEQQQTPALQAINGQLDLQGWDFNLPGQNVVALKGQWEVYWRQLLTPADFLESTVTGAARQGDLVNYYPGPVSSSLVLVPGPWPLARDLDRESPIGYATYRLIVSGLPLHETFGIRKTLIRNASAIYINGQLLLQDGVPAARPDLFQAGNISQMTFFETSSPDLEIVVQAASDAYLQSGIAGPIFLGREQALVRSNLKQIQLELFTQIVLLTMGLVYLFIQLITRRIGQITRTHYSFTLLCWFLALVYGLMSERTILLLWPGLPYEASRLLLNIGIVGTNVSAIFLIHQLDNECFTRRDQIFLRVFLGAGGGLFLVLPQLYHFFLTAGLAIVGSCFFGLSFGRNLVRFFRRPAPDQPTSQQAVALFAMACLIALSIDIASFSFGLVQDMLISQISGLALALAMIFMLGIRFYDTYTKNLQALYELACREQETVAAENALLRSHINPLFQDQALGTIIDFCCQDVARANALLGSLSTCLRGRFDFDWTDQKIRLARELELIRAFLDLEQARLAARLHICLDVPEELLQRQIPAYSIQPLVENAVEHGLICKPDGGTLWITIRQLAQALQVTVRDDGIGMTADQLAAVQNALLTPSQSGHRPVFMAGGMVIPALIQVQRRLLQAGSSGLTVQSTPDSGTTVQFCV